MRAVEVGADELRRLVADAATTPPWDADGAGLLVVDLDAAEPTDLDVVLPPSLPAVVVGRSSDPAAAPACCDAVLDDAGAVEQVAAVVGRHPVAALTLVGLLRVSDGLTVDAGLLAESACYGALQAGGEFRRWRAARPAEPVPATADPVLVRRDGDVLRLTLHRPDRRNALDAGMRDALAEQLALVALDPSIRRVVLDGAGPSFCSGGDLDEFGTAPDPAVAHLVRQERSLGRALHAVRDRVEVRLHGACVGSGIELAAFAGTVRAAPDVAIGLPELSMGLIPGAGGTVSITRRVGRHRTCRLALTGERIGAATAQGWGLVDEVTGADPQGRDDRRE
ncbi:enoyl-CoA hydratase/isomerase family protein [Dermatobacter hominis]|uniref:enoyl-CoA hydratase/isomerase family protein n=1 Tax=Dermatobacter hominis TaxID=2884263 RepID=UPI001D10BA1C|nr:enoyl-CoA hydratase/isomerase family protein [Dermatobacter hominis]UDY36621.1 enoyl-CoA hydratase/isomerase family protein [Dermatobacter hominis]